MTNPHEVTIIDLQIINNESVILNIASDYSFYGFHFEDFENQFVVF